MVWEEIDKDSNDFQTRFCMARKPLRIEKNRDKPNLHNARRLRGIYFIDPDDEESKEILTSVKRKIGKTFGSNHAVHKTTEHHESGCEAGNCIREEFQNSVLLYRGTS